MAGGRAIRTAACAGVLAVLASGCGGSGGSTESAATTISPTSTAPTTAPPPVTTVPAATTTQRLPSVAQDAATAQRILLRAGDLPGYQASSTSEPVGYVGAYSQCVPNPLLPGGRTGRSAGQGPFVLDETAVVRVVQTTSISSFAALAESESDARRLLADLAKPSVGPCVGKALMTKVNELTSRPATSGSQTTSALPALKIGDESTGLRTAVAGSGPVSQYFDLTVVRKGRALAYLFVVRLSKDPPPEADRQRLAGVIVSRIA